MVNKLKGYRNMAGLSQNDMSRILGYSRENYSYKENGKLKFSKIEEEKIYQKLKSKIPNLKKSDLFE